MRLLATLGKAWSGSWLGYQAKIYYNNLIPPPPGVHFNQEWGRVRNSSDWQELDEEIVSKAIYELANNPDMSASEKLAKDATDTFNDKKQEVLSLLCFRQAHMADWIVGILPEIRWAFYRSIRSVQDYCNTYSNVSASFANHQVLERVFLIKLLFIFPMTPLNGTVLRRLPSVDEIMNNSA